MAYRLQNRKDRWKAMFAALGVTAVLGAILISGLNVEIVGRAIERLESFDIALQQPPPEEPPPELAREGAREEQGAPGRRAEPTEIVAPEPEVELPAEQPVTAAPVPGTGTAPSAGAASAGTGTGAGGTGSGLGGGGTGGTGVGSLPARLTRNLTHSDYRRLAGNRLPQGSAALALRVNAQGRVDSCRVIRSSGDSRVDAGLCPLASRRLRFEPARDREGRPIPYFTNYFASWRRR